MLTPPTVIAYTGDNTGGGVNKFEIKVCGQGGSLAFIAVNIRGRVFNAPCALRLGYHWR